MSKEKPSGLNFSDLLNYKLTTKLYLRNYCISQSLIVLAYINGVNTLARHGMAWPWHVRLACMHSYTTVCV